MSEYKSITTRHADGYYGWEQDAPFDKVIVTCAIDHIPPPLLQQMKPNGIMVIPVGPPGAQHALKVTKQQAADGSISIARSDIYHGGRVSFVPFTRLEGDLIKDTRAQVTGVSRSWAGQGLIPYPLRRQIRILRLLSGHYGSAQKCCPDRRFRPGASFEREEDVRWTQTRASTGPKWTWKN